MKNDGSKLHNVAVAWRRADRCSPPRRTRVTGRTCSSSSSPGSAQGRWSGKDAHAHVCLWVGDTRMCGRVFFWPNLPEGGVNLIRTFFCTKFRPIIEPSLIKEWAEGIHISCHCAPGVWWPGLQILTPLFKYFISILRLYFLNLSSFSLFFISRPYTISLSRHMVLGALPST